MKNNLMEYPHPVLVPGGKDFTDSSFSMSLIEQNDENKELVFKFKCELKCESLKEMISKGALKIIIKITCPRTSYRISDRAISLDIIEVSIPKDQVNDTVFVQGMIVSAMDGVEYKLDDFNQKYFGEQIFVLKKGDIVAPTSSSFGSGRSGGHSSSSFGSSRSGGSFGRSGGGSSHGSIGGGHSGGGIGRR